MTRFLSLILISLALSFSSIYAASTDTFLVSIADNPMKPGVATDMTIKAVRADGSVIQDYKGNVVLNVENTKTTFDYDLPNGGFYQFTAQDQGIKTFSKGLMIKTAGVYPLTVMDLTTETMATKLSLNVGSTDTTSATPVGTSVITIVSPTSGEIIEGTSLTIIGKTESKRTPVQVFIDDSTVPVIEGESDVEGNIMIIVPVASGGTHTLKLGLVNYQGQSLGMSEPMSYTLKAPATDAYLKEITITPSSNTINRGETITIDIKTAGDVRSVEIKIPEMGIYPLERTSAGVFTKTIMIDKTGILPIDLTLLREDGQRTVYTARATIVVKAVNGVSTVKIAGDTSDPTKVTLSWLSLGKPTNYVVRYGTSKEALTNEAKSSTTKVTIGGLTAGVGYYFQVFALDQSGSVSGKGSDVGSLMTKASTDTAGAIASTCTIVGIKVRTEKIGDQYMLVRDAISGATSYNIYKSDFMTKDTSAMQKITTTGVPQYIYPFDIHAKKSQYAYYAVTATCADGQEIKLDSTKKIQVGPVEDMIVLCVVTMILYGLHRVYRYN